MFRADRELRPYVFSSAPKRARSPLNFAMGTRDADAVPRLLATFSSTVFTVTKLFISPRIPSVFQTSAAQSAALYNLTVFSCVSPLGRQTVSETKRFSLSYRMPISATAGQRSIQHQYLLRNKQFFVDCQDLLKRYKLGSGMTVSNSGLHRVANIEICNLLPE